MNETLGETFASSITATVQAPDLCAECMKFASDGYAEWYEAMPVSAAPSALTPVAAVPEPSALVLLAVGLAVLGHRGRVRRG